MPSRGKRKGVSPPLPSGTGLAKFWTTSSVTVASHDEDFKETAVDTVKEFEEDTVKAFEEDVKPPCGQDDWGVPSSQPRPSPEVPASADHLFERLVTAVDTDKADELFGQDRH